MVPENILIIILLDYAGDFSSWLSARCLNRTCLESVKKETETVSAEAYGTSGMICYARCGSCNKCSDDLSWLSYHTNIVGSSRYIVRHCNKWRCKVDVLKCMIEHARVNRKVILLEPWSNDVTFEIPRSEKRDANGNIKFPEYVTSGSASTRWVYRVGFRYCAHCEWICPNTNESFYKAVDIYKLGFKGEIKPVNIFWPSI